MSSTLHHPAVAAVLARLCARADAEDPPAKARVEARERELGRKIYGRERVGAYGGAPLAISAEVGELLYVLAVARRPRTIVEFGASLGYSTIHLAAALRDAGGDVLFYTELSDATGATAIENIAQAGLDDLVDLRVGGSGYVSVQVPLDDGVVISTRV